MSPGATKYPGGVDHLGARAFGRGGDGADIGDAPRRHSDVSGPNLSRVDIDDPSAANNAIRGRASQCDLD